MAKILVPLYQNFSPLENYQYLFVVYSVFFVCIVLFCLLINTILLKFSTTLGIRENEKPIIRWSSVSRPALGGISFYISFLLSTACYGIFFESNNVFNDSQAIALLSAASLAFLMGLADDAYNTRPFLKLFVQIGCGGMLVLGANYSSSDNHLLVIQLFENNIYNYILTILWVVGIMNSINMLDNMDGITTITSLFIILPCIFYISIHQNFENFDYIALLGVLASLIAFLFYNLNPSRMFMGDSGSQFLGLFIAAIGIKYLWNSTTFNGDVVVSKQIVTVLLAFILPIIDTTSVVINRISRKQSPFIGGKDHTTHHLSYLGFSDSQVGYIFLGISSLSSIICFAFFRFVDYWNHYSTFGFIVYFLAIFASLYWTTQKNKSKRK